MPAWVASLSKEDGPTNWDLCVEHALMGTRAAAAGSIKTGDEVFIWLAETGLIAWTRALEDARPAGGGEGLPWPSPESYKYVWRMEVVDDRIDDPVQLTWAQVKADAGITASPQFFPKVPPEGVAALSRNFDDFPRDVSRLERVMLRALPTDDQRRYRDATRPVREGQRGFRDVIDQAYESRCAITGTSDRATLQAAHIAPYLGAASNQTRNGMLLRSDLHALFDAYLLTVTPDGVVVVADSVMSPEYRQLHGRSIRLPTDPRDHPDSDELAARLVRFTETGPRA